MTSPLRLSDQERMKAFLDEVSNLLGRKGNDYAGENTFDAFRKASGIAGISVKQSILNLIGIKVARISSLSKVGGGRVPNFESIQDSLKDLVGYAALLALAYEDEKELTKENLADEIREITGQDGKVWVAGLGVIREKESDVFNPEVKIWEGQAKNIEFERDVMPGQQVWATRNFEQGFMNPGKDPGDFVKLSDGPQKGKDPFAPHPGNVSSSPRVSDVKVKEQPPIPKILCDLPSVDSLGEELRNLSPKLNR